MKQYLLSVHYVAGEAATPPEDMEKAVAAVDALNQRMQDEGAWVFACGLEAPETSTVVDNTGAQVVTTDGPFSEAKEQIGGFWVIKAPDLDAALKWATDASAACVAPVDVRPLQDDAED